MFKCYEKHVEWTSKAVSTMHTVYWQIEFILHNLQFINKSQEANDRHWKMKTHELRSEINTEGESSVNSGKGRLEWWHDVIQDLTDMFYMQIYHRKKHVINGGEGGSMCNRLLLCIKEKNW